MLPNKHLLYRPRSGLSRVEKIFALVVLVIICALAYPRYIKQTKTYTEQYAIEVLKIMHDDQMRFQQQAIIDDDGDQKGEFATVSILQSPDTFSAQTPGMQQHYMEFEPVPDYPDICLKNGFYYKIFIDTKMSAQSIDNREQFFVIVAWPKTWQEDGERCFFMTIDAKIYEQSSPIGNGLENSIELDELFSTPFDFSNIIEGWTLLGAKPEPESTEDDKEATDKK